jgi:hypothetical protein
MINEEEKFDDLIRQKMSEREFFFDELNWDKVDAQIERNDKLRKFKGFLRIFIGGAALGVAVTIPIMHYLANPKNNNLVANTETTTQTTVITPQQPLAVTNTPGGTSTEHTNSTPGNIAPNPATVSAANKNFDKTSTANNAVNSVTSSKSSNANPVVAENNNALPASNSTNPAHTKPHSTHLASAIASRDNSHSNAIVEKPKTTSASGKPTGGTSKAIASNNRVSESKKHQNASGNISQTNVGQSSPIASNSALTQTSNNTAANNSLVQNSTATSSGNQAQSKGNNEAIAVGSNNSSVQSVNNSSGTNNSVNQVPVSATNKATENSAGKSSETASNSSTGQTTNKSAENSTGANSVAANNPSETNKQNTAQNNSQKSSDSSNANNTASSTAAAPPPLPPLARKNVKGTFQLGLEIGGNYSFGWSINGTNEANGITPLAGIYGAYFFGPKIALSLGAQFNELTNLKSGYTTTHTTYSFGYTQTDTTVTPNTIYYVGVPLTLQYHFNDKNAICIGASMLFLINVSSTFATSAQTDLGPKITQTSNVLGYTSGFSTTDLQLRLAYRRKIWKGFWASAEYYYGLTNLEETPYFSNSSAKNSGLRLILSYNIIDR